jgi:molecular chaperone DnaK
MYIGIDLGTSNSAIVGNEDGLLRVFKDSDGADVLPSAIFYDKRGHKFIGKRAYDNLATSPENVAREFKRLMGTSSPISLPGAAIELTPEDCSAEIIETLLRQAKTERGDFAIDGAVVTIPAAFNQLQSEATIRAAHEAGLERVALLQEPIAAAMASLAAASNKNALFLVYDIGGGTFDVALVQSIGGAVHVLAHEGINMLGGTDFDRMLVNAFVRPWLATEFSLPADYQKNPHYRRLIGLGRHAAEKAKIELSSNDHAVIFAGEDEVRVKDENGNDIYLSIDIARSDIEGLIAERVGETVGLCRQVLKDSGYSHGDIDRVVLIGGPSKMPYIRNTVPHELGIPIDTQIDPMTAVATGAAIFAESRDWSAEGTTRKASRATVTSSGLVEIRYDFPARTSDESARLRLNPAGTVDGCRMQVDTHEGWTSGLVDVATGTTLQLPLSRPGENRFRITVFDAAGAPLREASCDIVITKVHASAAGIPATHSLAVKVIEESASKYVNALDQLVAKGTPLPAEGTRRYRAARDLRGGQIGHIDIELFQQRDGVPEPELNLPVGVFRLDAMNDLEPGQQLRKGAEIIIHWAVDDNGLVKCAIEVPNLQQKFQSRNFYDPTISQLTFTGEDGEALALSMLHEADEDLASAEALFADSSSAELQRLRHRLERSREELLQSSEADTRRQASEEARQVRQEMSRLRHQPRNRAAVLQRQLDELCENFSDYIGDDAELKNRESFDGLSRTARQAIDDGHIPEAELALEQMNSIYYRELHRQPAFVVRFFKSIAAERFLAVDKAMHDELVAEGGRALAANEIDRLRGVIGKMLDNLLLVSTGDRTVAAMAGLMKA